MHGREAINERGFTLIEVLVALSILAVAIMGLFSTIGSTLRAVETGKRQTQAINIASEKLEMLKSVPYSNIHMSGDGTQAGDDAVVRSCSGVSPSFECNPTTENPTTVGNVDYTWKWTVTFLDLDGDGSLGPEPLVADTRDIKKIDVDVSWTDLQGDHTMTLTTLRIM